MQWTYDCTSFGSAGDFEVVVNQPNGDVADDEVTDELGNSGSGTDYYGDAGEFTLEIESECEWSVTIVPTDQGPPSLPVSFDSGQSGVTANTKEFAATGPWTLDWQYNCPSNEDPGEFTVEINQPSDDDTLDLGPDQLGVSGSGSNNYDDSGVFSLDVVSECNWSIDVVPTITPPTTPTGAPPSDASASPNSYAVGIAATPDGGGYWIAYSDGAVSAHGDAQMFGSIIGNDLNAPITEIVSTPSSMGYWLVAADGGIFSFGAAQYYGSLGGMHLNASVVSMAATPDGRGYWLVAADGGVFAFGDAQFFGSTANDHLNRPVVGIAATPDGRGYWLVAADGGVFAFGDAQFFGSTGDLVLNAPIDGLAVDDESGGYWLSAFDGGVFAEGVNFYGEG
jgi:hypothetical protein